MIISNEKFAEYLEYSKLNIQCPACGCTTGWNVNAAHEMQTDDRENDLVVNHIPYARLDEKTNRTTTFLGGFPVVFIVCKSCGYVRIHSYSLLHSKITDMDATKRNERNND
ncbi:hypothetical protein BSQ40_08000 [Serratia fonticola]|nr:hypothetical protein BSQ40_08000 [Serratia fonticola]